MVSTLAACGGKSSASPGEGGDGGTGAGGSGSGGQAHAGSSNGGTSACAIFDDEFGTNVNIAMVNATTAPIYLGQDMVNCNVSPLFQVNDARGGALPSLGSCRTSCSMLRAQGFVGCPDICAFPNAITLQPMETYYTTWDGLYGVQQQLPTKCAPAEHDSTLTCEQAQRITPGTYSFSAVAGSSLDCSQTSGQDVCMACTPGPNGGCATSGSLITGQMHKAQTTVVLNESYGVYPAPAPAPAPAPGSAGDAAPAPGGAQAVLTVQLIFNQ